MTGGAPEARHGLRDQVVRGVGWSSGRIVVGILVQFVTIIVVSRYLSPAEVGVVAVGFAIIQLVILVSHLGVDSALVQRVEVTPNHVGAAFAIAAVGSVAWVVVIWLAAGRVAESLDFPDLATVLPALSVILLFQAAGGIYEALLKRDMRFRRIATADLLTTGAVYGLVSIVGAVLGYGLWSLVAGHVSGFASRTLYLGVTRNGRLSFRTSPSAVRDLLSYGLFASLSSFIGQSTETLDRVIIGSVLGPNAAGLYVRGRQIVQIASTAITFPLGSVLFPALSKVQHDAVKLRLAYRNMQSLLTLISLPGAFVVLATSPAIVPFLLGDNWSAIVGPVQILAVGLFVRSYGFASAVLLNAMGRVRARVAVEVLHFVLVVGSILALAGWGLNWVCLGVVGSMAVRTAILGWLAGRAIRLSVGEAARVLTPGVVVTAIMAGCAGIAFLWLGAPLFHLAGAVAMLLVAGVAMLYLLLFDTRLGLPEELIALRPRFRMRLSRERRRG